MNLSIECMFIHGNVIFQTCPRGKEGECFKNRLENKIGTNACEHALLNF